MSTKQKYLIFPYAIFVVLTFVAIFFNLKTEILSYMWLTGFCYHSSTFLMNFASGRYKILENVFGLIVFALLCAAILNLVMHKSLLQLLGVFIGVVVASVGVPTPLRENLRKIKQ